MPRTRFKNASLVLPNRLVPNASIDISDGKIEAIDGSTSAGMETSVDCTGLTLMPGFIDVHNHGAMGIDVNDADVDGLLEIAKFLATRGVTAWMPTLVPDSDENYERIISNIDRLMEIQTFEPIAQAVGVHYEGVFANEKMCGALRPEYFKKFTDGQLGQLPKLGRGVHMTTFAPEIDGGIGLARELTAQGWVASIGHTKADIETLDKAFAAGARHLTHFFNAMTPMHHRDVGVVGWALTNPDVTFDIIADGVHVHPKMLEFACRTKTPDRVSLISDSVAPTGLGDGEFEIWGEKVTVDSGRTRNERGSIAGSVITMLDAANRMMSIGFTNAEVAQMASLNPAKLLRIDNERGSIEKGKRADIVALDSVGEVRLSMIGGRVVFDNR
ncbi:MAG: N-acetylglucosamine-6-phosphate deacetylase [Pyrinomonadaceae bacterium]